MPAPGGPRLDGPYSERVECKGVRRESAISKRLFNTGTSL